MSLAASTSKSNRIAARLRERIRGGDLTAGDRIPSVRALAEEFGVSIGAVQYAQNALVEEGWIERVRGRGVYVRRRGGRAIRRLALLRNCIEQPAFDEARTAVSLEVRLGCLPIDIVKEDLRGAARGLPMVGGEDEVGVLADVHYRVGYPEDVLAAAGRAPVCFVHRWEWNEPPRAPAVLIDHVHVYGEALDYLFRRGHRKIRFVSWGDSPHGFRRKQLEAIARKAGMAFPSDRFDWIFNVDARNDPALLDAHFAGPDPVTALIGADDYQAFLLRDVLRRRYPDKALPETTGLYKTKWSVQSGQAFHSFDPHWESMWRAAFRALAEFGSSVPEVTWIRPTFLHRYTSGETA